MEFEDAASFFDDDPVYDAYTGALLFYCHTTPHDDQTSSGATARRRTMTTSDTTVAPARGAVKVYEDYWLVSDSNPDSLMGTNVRRSYSLKKSTGGMTRLSPAEACTGAAGTEFYAHKEYYRDNQNARTDADWDTMWNIFTAQAEPIAKGVFLRQGGVLYRARNVYPTVDGFLIAETDQLDDDAATTATFTTTGNLNLVTDELETVSIVASVLQTDTQKFYQFRTQAESAHQPGDRAVFVPQATLAPAVGSSFTMLGATWRVIAAVPERDVWVLHARRA